MLMRDARGNKSWTHTLAIPSMIFATIRFIVGGITIPIPNYPVNIPAWDIATYMGFAGLWMMYLGQHNYVERVSSPRAQKSTEKITEKTIINEVPPTPKNYQ